MKFDSKDIKILELLQEDGKITHKEIAEKLGLSVTPVYERIKKLEKAKYISKYVALVEPKTVGLEFCAFSSIKLKEHESHKIAIFEEQVALLDEVQECFHLAGDSDYLLKVHVKDMEEYQRFLTTKLASIENISNVKSSFVMKEIKRETKLPVENIPRRK